MNFWISLSAQLRAPAGGDQERYAGAVAVVARCFAGAAWLKRRFPARSYGRGRWC